MPENFIVSCKVRFALYIGVVFQIFLYICYLNTMATLHSCWVFGNGGVEKRLPFEIDSLVKL